MTRRFPVVLTGAFVAGLCALSLPVAAQKGKTPPTLPGTFTIRTPVYVGDTPGQDRVTGDGLPYTSPGTYAADTDGTYVNLNGNREFSARLYGSRYVMLDFLQAVSGTLCTSNCFSTFLANRFVIPQANFTTSQGPFRVFMQTNVVNGSNVEIPNGLFGILPGQSSPARFYFTFMDPEGRDFHWSVLFNPAEYPGSNLVQVTRSAMSPCTWTIEGPAGTQGGLRAWAVLKGRNNSSDEGRFEMPFALNFTVPNCGA